METQNRNMGGGQSYRASHIKKEGPQVRSLRETGGLPSPSKPKPLRGFNQPSPQPRMHSQHSSARSEHYRARVVGGQRAVDDMNPTKTIKATRSFPGLANGE